MRKLNGAVSKVDKNYYILFGISLILLFPLISYFYVNGHDVKFHYSNVYAIVQYFWNRQLPSVILPTIANNFGYGTGLFYPKLAHVIIAFIKVLFKVEIITAFKIFQFFVTFLSGIFMYNLVKKISKNKLSALIAATFYITAPYFLSDFYIRSALAESLVFIFTPIIFLGLYELFENNNLLKFYLFFIIGFLGIVNSHLITGMFLFGITSIYLILNYKKVFDKKIFFHLAMASLIIIIYALPFLITIIEHRVYGDYSIFIDGYMGNPDWAYGTALNFSDFLSYTFNEKNNGIAFYFNIIMLAMFIMTIVMRKEVTKRISKNYLYNFSLIGIFITLFSTKLFPWDKFPSFMHMIQFPWRLEIFSIFFISIVSSFLVTTWNKNKVETFIPIIIIASVFIGLNSIDYKYINYFDLNVDVSYYGMGSQKEYLPTKALNNYEYLESRTQDIIIINGEANIIKEDIQFPSLKFKIYDVYNNVTVEIPRLYYLGYRIKYVNGDNITYLEYRENTNGFIEFDIPGNGEIFVMYEGTKLNKLFSNSACALSIIIIFFSINYIREKHGYKYK